MKLLNERIGFLLPEGSRALLDRASIELRVRPSDYVRAALFAQLQRDGFLKTGRKLTDNLKQLGRVAA